MPFINIVAALVIAGSALWLINRYVPTASGIKTILNVVVTVAVGIWVLQVTGLWGPISNYRFTR
jgi:predicted membrane protein